MNILRNKRSVVLATIIVFASFVFLIQHTQAISCHQYTSSQPVLAGFGAAYSIFGNASNLLIRGDCSSSAVAVTVGPSESNSLVYKTAYRWDGTQWNAVTLNGIPAGGSTIWLGGGGATAVMAFPPSKILYAAAYVCEYANGWQCGCRSQTQCSSASVSYWNLQKFDGNGIIAGDDDDDNDVIGDDDDDIVNASCQSPKDIFLNPFNKNSAHHRPIGSGAQYASATHPTTKDWMKKSVFAVNVGGPWGADLATVSNADPLYTVTGTGFNIGLPTTVRFPAAGFDTNIGYNQYGTTDGVSVIYNRTDNSVHEFFQYKWNNGSPTAAINRQWDIKGLGHGTKSGDRLGTSASGVAMLFGLLRGHEINTPGRKIEHVLQMVLPRLPGEPIMLSRDIFLPATNRDASAGQPANNTGSIPYGALMALPPSVNLDSLGLSEPGRRLAEAIRDYGIYVVDGGAGAIRADQHVSATVRAQLMKDISKIYPHIRMVLNNDNVLSSAAAGGGTPRAPNCAYDSTNTNGGGDDDDDDTSGTNGSAKPSGFSWTLMASDPTGWMTNSIIQQNWNVDHSEPGYPAAYPYRRLSITKAPDGSLAVKHTVAPNEIVWRLGHIAKTFDRKNSLDQAYLLRYQHWIVEYPGDGGKWMELEGGLGFGATTYRFDSGSSQNGITLGTDGWGMNIMHPQRGTFQNGIGMLASTHTNGPPDGYGINANSSGSYTVPKGRWFTVDALAVMPSTPTGTNRLRKKG